MRALKFNLTNQALEGLFTLLLSSPPALIRAPNEVSFKIQMESFSIGESFTPTDIITSSKVLGNFGKSYL